MGRFLGEFSLDEFITAPDACVFVPAGPSAGGSRAIRRAGLRGGVQQVGPCGEEGRRQLQQGAIRTPPPRKTRKKNIIPLARFKTRNKTYHT